MDFIIDTKGSIENDSSSIGTNNSILTKLLEEYREESCSDKPTTSKLTSQKKGADLQPFFEEMGWSDLKPQKKSIIQQLEKTQRTEEVEKVLKKSVLTPDFEKKHTVPPYEVSEQILKKERRKQAELTKGKKWYGMPATELTEEVKNDLEILQMRSALDPKRFYKKNDLKVLPKYFQVGKVMDSPLDFYNNRLTKKERKKTLVDELLADAEFTKYNKRKYKEIIQERQQTHYKAWRQAKKLKKKK